MHNKSSIIFNADRLFLVFKGDLQKKVYIFVGFVPPVVKNETVKGGLGDKGVCFGFLPST